jgi:hypothetical protein
MISISFKLHQRSFNVNAVLGGWHSNRFVKIKNNKTVLSRACDRTRTAVRIYSICFYEQIVHLSKKKSE